MSFVLEALKKQEAGSDPDAAVSLARSASSRRRNRLWAGLFAAAMVVNGLLLFWVFGIPRLSELRLADRLPAPEAAASASQDAEASQPTQSDVRAPSAASEWASTPARRPAPARAPSANATRNADTTQAIARSAPVDADAPAPSRAFEPAAAAPTRVALGDLPAAARARFPGIAFSTHIYSQDADLRAVVANGHRLQEGDRIRGLKIVEITETGVVLAFENYQVEVPIVVDWNSL